MVELSVCVNDLSNKKYKFYHLFSVSATKIVGFPFNKICMYCITLNNLH